MLAKSIFADALPMRVLPALLCAAIVYPNVGFAAQTMIGTPPWPVGYQSVGPRPPRLC